MDWGCGNVVEFGTSSAFRGWVRVRVLGYCFGVTISYKFSTPRSSVKVCPISKRRLVSP